MKKIILFILSFLIFFSFAFYGLNRVIPFVDLRQRAVWDDVYHGKIDYAFLGSSHVYCGVDPLLINARTDENSILISSGIQTLTQTYYNLYELLDYQSPKVVFVEMYGGYREFDQGNFTNIDCMRFSLNKIRMAQDVFPDTFILYSLFPLLREHSNWKNFDNLMANINYDKSEYNLGFSGIDTKVSDDQYDGYLEMEQDYSEFVMREADVTAIEKMIDLCAEKDVTLKFIMIPWIREFTERINYTSVVDAINKTIAPYELLDFMGGDYDKMGLDRNYFIEDKISNNQHLNIDGAGIFTNYLLDGGYLE